MYIKILKRVLPIVFLFLLVFEIQRSFSDFPRITTPSLSNAVTPSISNSLDIYFYFKDFSVFAYFTTLSNIFIVILMFLSWTLNIKINKYLKLSALIYMIITGVIFWTSLAPFFNWGANSYFDFINIHEHLLVVLMAFIWYRIEKSSDLKLKNAFGIAIIFPGIYLLFAIIIQVISHGNIAIYPFLNFKDVFNVSLSLGLSIFVAILTILIIIFSIWLLCFLYSKSIIRNKIKLCLKK